MITLIILTLLMIVATAITLFMRWMASNFRQVPAPIPVHVRARTRRHR